MLCVFNAICLYSSNPTVKVKVVVNLAYTVTGFRFVVDNAVFFRIIPLPMEPIISTRGPSII